MSGITEQRVQQTFVELADTLVDDYDVIAFLHMLSRRVVELLHATACGLALADHHGRLNLVAASSERSYLLELFQLQTQEGPCHDAYRSAAPVYCQDLTRASDKWPKFAAESRNAGYRSVFAVPMRLRNTVIGAMNVFNAKPGRIAPDAMALAQALADVATIGILHERNAHHYEHVAEQLQAALESRILVEQAKGKLAERLGISIDDAFAVLRDHARSNSRKLHEVAADVVNGTLRLTHQAKQTK
jgi:GAF domain-containing protein